MSPLSHLGESSVRRHIVWVCAGCDDCQPLDGSEPSRFPCTSSPSSDGAEVVLAEDYDRLAEHVEFLRRSNQKYRESREASWAIADRLRAALGAALGYCSVDADDDDLAGGQQEQAQRILAQGYEALKEAD